MTRRLGLLLLLVTLPLAAAQDVPFRSFKSGSFSQLVAGHAGKPFLLIMWSVTCAPCRQEFELLRDMRRPHPDMNLVLVSTDDISDSALAAKVLVTYGMEREESWIFADPNGAKLRYEIDPEWYGEMPRAYFYDAGHHREAVSGSLKREQVEGWLK